jgi:two-component system, NtrC family, response regulator PilR
MASLLIVDDDELIRDALYELLSEEHLCHTAETADKAVEWLNTESYDVILTDISMPGMNGVEFLGHARQLQPDTPVLIISGIRDVAYTQGLLKMGAFDYLFKPFRLEEVEDKVSRAIDYHRQLLKESRKVS